MAYTKTVWKNGASPAINAPNLNKIEQGILDAHNNPVFRKDESYRNYGYDHESLLISNMRTIGKDTKSNKYFIMNNDRYLYSYDVLTGAYTNIETVSSPLSTTVSTILIDSTGNYLYTVDIDSSGGSAVGYKIAVVLRRATLSSGVVGTFESFRSFSLSVNSPIGQGVNSACFINDNKLAIACNPYSGYTGAFFIVDIPTTTGVTITASQYTMTKEMFGITSDGTNVFVFNRDYSIDRRAVTNFQVTKTKRVNPYFLGEPYTALKENDTTMLLVGLTPRYYSGLTVSTVKFDLT